MPEKNNICKEKKLSENSKRCCNIESIVTIDERGQMVLPKEIRERANIVAGDKLAVISIRKNDKFCCISLIKAENLSGAILDMLGPSMK